MNYWNDGCVPKYVRSEESGSPALDAFATPISREISRFLALCGPSTSHEISEELAVPNLTVHRTLMRLENVGVMVGSPERGHRNGRRITWAINLDRTDQVTRSLANFVIGA